MPPPIREGPNHALLHMQFALHVIFTPYSFPFFGCNTFARKWIIFSADSHSFGSANQAWDFIYNTSDAGTVKYGPVQIVIPFN